MTDVEVPVGGMVLLPQSSTPAEIHPGVAKHGYPRYILTNDGNTTGVPFWRTSAKNWSVKCRTPRAP
ncbi:hypothetical protein [Arthrobacter sp. A5]|uniref:hypothetical protein n=1 Tax=Arthrobacter sp. A5 TaxID=576926 RepID=UPI003DA8B90F